jgi:DNA helicase HerA-like ATPase
MSNEPTSTAVNSGDTRTPEKDTFQVRSVPDRALDNLRLTGEEVGGAYTPLPGTEGAVAFTHFDSPSSEDHQLTILLTKENMDQLPSQTLVRINSMDDKGNVEHSYLGVVSAGPFAEPDGLRADSPIVVATTVQGKIFLPRYHGRAFVEILGEEVEGQIIPPRYRPRPNSPIFARNREETARVLKVGGNARMGLLVGHDDIVLGIPTDKKSVLPRHTGVMGTTGGGKSTTISRFVYEMQKAGVATILIDIEGEYTEIDLPTDDAQMQVALKRRGLKRDGTKNVNIYHLVGRESNREAEGGKLIPFCLRFSDLSPYAVMEILNLSEAQQERFYKAYDAARAVMRDLKIFPTTKEDEEELMDLDELETGYPKLTLSFLLDIVGMFRHQVSKDDREPEPFNPILRKNVDRVKERLAQFKTSHELSWLALLGRLYRINRLKIFDNRETAPIDYNKMIKGGDVSVVDLSDTDSPAVRNLVIADILRGVQRAQDEAVKAATAAKKSPTPVVIVIEEAHEFLSAQRIRQMPVLFEQVARIAKRGRKRWLGLAFVTQLPQHLPDEVLGLINNFVLHKITDSGVIDRLRKSIGGLDKAQWAIIPGLAPGQAMISLTTLARPLLVSVDPTPSRLRFFE